MAKYQEKPIIVEAYVIQSITPRDNEGSYVADVDGNLVVQAGNIGAAGTIPFTFAEAALTGFGIGDYVVIAADGTQSLIEKDVFLSTYTAV